MRKLTTIMLYAAMLLCSCTPQGSTELATFLSDSTVRLEIDGDKVFTYSPATCQLVYNEKRCEFRAHTDTMLDYFVISLNTLPHTIDTKVTATIYWSTNYGEKVKENITLETKRISGDVLWLCDESCRNAVVVRILE